MTLSTRSLRAAISRIAGDRLACQECKRFSLQSIARQDRDAVPVDDMQRRPAPAQHVVVHGGQVVVNQRVGVNQLDCAGRRQSEGCIGAEFGDSPPDCTRATASAAASARTGRRRLPPANTL